MSVKVGCKHSDRKQVTSGVQQGSVLGPLLFLVYVSDLMVGSSCVWKAYADDYKLCSFYSRESLESTPLCLEELQGDLNVMAERSSAWNLKLNVDKCKVMRFGRGNVGEARYLLNGTRLESVNVYRDLGVMVDVSLRFHHHVKSIAGKAGSLMNCLLRTTVCRSAESMTKLFVSHIKPLMEYASTVWSTGFLGDLRLLEGVQRRWTKEIDGLRQTEYIDRLQSLDLYSIKGRLLRMDLIKVWKCFHSTVDVGLSSMFVLANNDRLRGHSLKLKTVRCNLEARRRSFFMRVVNEWNSLPSSIVEKSSLESFKYALGKHLGDRLFQV